MSEENPENNADHSDMKTDDVDNRNEQGTQLDTDISRSDVLKAYAEENMCNNTSDMAGENSENVSDANVKSSERKVDDGCQSETSETGGENSFTKQDLKEEKNKETKQNHEEEIKLRGDINILLLSETGVGKTTFVNAIANYLTHRQFERAEKEKLRVLISAKFSIEDKNGKRHDVSVGVDDKNEFLNAGDSATQDVKSYIFPIGKNHPNIRIIDTPGMGDTRGPEQDNKNCDYILNYISTLKELHAICCLFRSTNTRNTIYFQYCITEILSRLDKSASRNIVFVFTNTRGSNYSSGETYDILRKTLDDIKNKNQVEITLQQNIFCFDNEAFRYLAAIRRGVKFEESVREKYKDSWNKSTKQFWNLIKYVKSIDAHLVQSTNAVNEARRMINHLAQPLADISELIHDNIEVLQRHRGKLDIENMTLDQLKNEMFMPVVDLEVVALDQPTTTCTSLKCSEIYKVGDKNKWHYKQRCHEPCYLSNVKADTVNNPALIDCAAMDHSSGVCIQCGCNYLVHMHVYYMTSTIEKRIENANALKNIDDSEKFLAEVEKLMNDIAVKKEELEKEHDTIVTSCAKFTHFLQKNAITPFNDAYKEYIEYLITREQSLGALASNNKTVQHLRNLLQKYEETKKLFDNALNMKDGSGKVVQVTSNEILGTVKELYNLKHTGNKIKELYECQEISRKREHAYTEYIHHSTPRKTGNYERNTRKKNEKVNKTSKSSGNQEGLFRSLLHDFFSMFSFGSSTGKKGTNPQVSDKEMLEYFRNVQVVAGSHGRNTDLLNQPFVGNPYEMYPGSSSYFQSSYTPQQAQVHKMPMLNMPINMPVQQYQKLMDEYLSTSSHNNNPISSSPHLNPNISNDSGNNDPTSLLNNSTIDNKTFKYPEHQVPDIKSYHYGAPSARPTQYFGGSYHRDYEQFHHYKDENERYGVQSNPYGNRFDRYDDRRNDRYDDWFDRRNVRYNDLYDRQNVHYNDRFVRRNDRYDDELDRRNDHYDYKYDPRYDRYQRRADYYDDPSYRCKGRADHFEDRSDRLSGYGDQYYRYDDRPYRYENRRDRNELPSRHYGAPLKSEEFPSDPDDSHKNDKEKSNINNETANESKIATDRCNRDDDPYSRNNTSAPYDFSSGRFIVHDQRDSSDRRDASPNQHLEALPNRHDEILPPRSREVLPNRSREVFADRQRYDYSSGRFIASDQYDNSYDQRDVSPNRHGEVSTNRHFEILPKSYRRDSYDQHKADHRSSDRYRSDRGYGQSQYPSDQYLYSKRDDYINDRGSYNSAGRFNAQSIDRNRDSSMDHDADPNRAYKTVDYNRSGYISNNQQVESSKYHQSESTQSPNFSDSYSRSDQKELSNLDGNNSEPVITKDELATNQEPSDKFEKTKPPQRVVPKNVISYDSSNKNEHNISVDPKSNNQQIPSPEFYQ